MNRRIVAALSLGIAALAGCSSSGGGGTSDQASTTTATESPGWMLAVDDVQLGMQGVSPHVDRVAEGDRVWRSDGPQGTTVSLCDEGGACRPETMGTRVGVDFTALTLADGTRRAYFKEFDPSDQMQAVYSAPCLDATCLAVGERTLASPEMRISMEVRAWGVPDPVVLPDGRVRLYIVESPEPGRCTEKIASYVSDDGVEFVKEPGWRLEGGFVDSEILRARDGDWVMVVADIGCARQNAQSLFVSVSEDGLAWSDPVILTDSGPSRFDPAGYDNGDGTFRIYFSEAPSLAEQTFTIRRGRLTAGA